MAIRRTLAQFSDEIVAADLADDSVTTAKIKKVKDDNPKS